MTTTKNYLMTWQRVTKEPKLEEIYVTEWQDTDELQDGWAIFTYTGGDHDGCTGGTERRNVLTEAQANEVRQAWADISKAKADARALNKGAKGVFEDIIKRMADPARDVG